MGIELCLEDVLSEFNHAVKISPCPRTTICNKCAKSNTSGDILKTGDNADDEEIFGFSGSYLKIAHRHLGECTKSKITEFATREYETPDLPNGPL